ncbi:hypothetical protein JIN85_15630 [Luteolibacter pohnpeiensis]|uniref:Uncharacterized protein n=1 Tax=Luteolibacter pohnpeiensis TaxID=454153 RepID=A0A934SER4_9BACT|nr:hypothetical protein [Luteolibacter pohnpeiensis]
MTALLAIIAFFPSCKDGKKSDPLEHRAQISINKNSGKKTEREAIRFALEFIKTAYGQDVANELSNSEFPTNVVYNSQENEWYVALTNGISTINVILDGSLRKGTLVRMDGLIYKKNIEDVVDRRNPPLFTIDEFKEICKLPHNE